MSDSIDDLPFYFKIGTKKDTCEASVFESDSVVMDGTDLSVHPRYYYITFDLYFNYSLISHVSTFILSEIEFYPLQTGVTLRYFCDFIPQIV